MEMLPPLAFCPIPNQFSGDDMGGQDMKKGGMHDLGLDTMLWKRLTEEQQLASLLCDVSDAWEIISLDMISNLLLWGQFQMERLENISERAEGGKFHANFFKNFPIFQSLLSYWPNKIYG
jgi:hypothetical protein